MAGGCFSVYLVKLMWMWGTIHLPILICWFYIQHLLDLGLCNLWFLTCCTETFSDIAAVKINTIKLYHNCTMQSSTYNLPTSYKVNSNSNISKPIVAFFQVPMPIGVLSLVVSPQMHFSLKFFFILAKTHSSTILCCYWWQNFPASRIAISGALCHV